MQVSLRVASTTFAGIQTAVDTALNDFFEETDYTYEMAYIQGDFEYDTEGKPVRYQAEVVATTVPAP